MALTALPNMERVISDSNPPPPLSITTRYYSQLPIKINCRNGKGFRKKVKLRQVLLKTLRRDFNLATIKIDIERTVINSLLTPSPLLKYGVFLPLSQTLWQGIPNERLKCWTQTQNLAHLS